MSQTDIHTKEVYYDQYCKTCKHQDVPESEDPCDECLELPSNEDSHKPVYYEEDSKKVSKLSRENATCCCKKEKEA